MLAVICAAGFGKRMRSPLPKVLHTINGHTMLYYVVKIALNVSDKVFIVVSDNETDIRSSLISDFPDRMENFIFVRQSKPLGTGHAIKKCLPYFVAYPEDTRVIIFPGDVPLIQHDTIAELIRLDKNAVLTHVKETPFGCGRIVLNDKNQVHRIIEEKDCTDSERENKLINCGIYVCNVETLNLVKRIQNNNSAKEYYLTDLVELAYDDGMPFQSVVLPYEKRHEFFNINTPEELEMARAEMARNVQV